MQGNASQHAPSQQQQELQPGFGRWLPLCVPAQLSSLSLPLNTTDGEIPAPAAPPALCNGDGRLPTSSAPGPLQSRLVSYAWLGKQQPPLQDHCWKPHRTLASEPRLEKGGMPPRHLHPPAPQ